VPPVIGRGLVLAILLAPSFAHAADDEGEKAARTFFEPADPWALVSLSGGVGGFPSAQTINPRGQLVGHGGFGTLAARVDVEALEPVWFSVAGRTFVGTPSEAELDASIGYNIRIYAQEHFGTGALDRLELRPLVGLKEIRAADSVTLPTSVGATALRFGGDFLWQSSANLKGVGAFQLHLVGLWDFARQQAGVELEVRDIYPVSRRSLDGIFIGLGVGYLPSTRGYGQLEFGVAWELGKR
jgi:hypothetical protein